ncbi:hypothetical protein HY412_02445 [Candidatus Kaiserbacteria bacterium]|nr:hypothetical protein [Candidatus Kaiserbacteria bacterium]
MKLLMFPFVIRIGLALVFLANSLIAFLEPSEFQDLISGSFVENLLPVSVATFVSFIGVNDLIVAVLLFIGWRTTYVARYATLWLVGVILVVGAFSIEALEHLGFLAMALALAMSERTE